MSSVVAVLDHPRHVQVFVEQGLNEKFDRCTAIGFANAQSGLVAGFVYHNYDPDSNVIEVSGFSTNRDWCTPALFKVIFKYPFEQLGVRLVVARHSEQNKRVRRIWKTLGAKEYLIPELRAAGEADAIAVLSKATWNNSKFMRTHHG